MDAKKRVGLVYSYNENWIAGSYYILNIIHALNTLEDKLKPKIILLTDSFKNFKKVKAETKYPYLTYCNFPFHANYSLFERGINKISKIIFNKKLIKKTAKIPEIDFLYPNEIKQLTKNFKKVNWIPDFQEEHLPHFFSQEEVANRKEYQKSILVNSDAVVFSSEDAKKDFEKLYSESKAQRFVLPFAVTHPDFSKERIDDLLDKYDLPKKYFFAPNQFWAHKNHIVILKAVKILKEKGINVVVAFSGKEYDSRNLNNCNLLKKYILDNDLEKNIKFLGFLPRTEQLSLMNNSHAIIQPSLFEGWSTVVEDAKALNKFIILSDLAVHREQIDQNVHFFGAKDENQLSYVLATYSSKDPKIKKLNYGSGIKTFGLNFLRLLDGNI